MASKVVRNPINLGGDELLAIRQAVYQGVLTLTDSGMLETSVPIRLACVMDRRHRHIEFRYDFPEAFTKKPPENTGKCPDFRVKFIEGVAPLTLARIVVGDIITNVLQFGPRMFCEMCNDDGLFAWWFRVEPELTARRDAILSKDVMGLETSVRVYAHLKSSNILTLGDLAQRTEAEMLRVKNFGRTSLAEVKELLAPFGLWLGMTKAELKTFVPLN